MLSTSPHGNLEGGGGRTDVFLASKGTPKPFGLSLCPCSCFFLRRLNSEGQLFASFCSFCACREVSTSDERARSSCFSVFFGSVAALSWAPSFLIGLSRDLRPAPVEQSLQGGFCMLTFSAVEASVREGTFQGLRGSNRRVMEVHQKGCFKNA